MQSAGRITASRPLQKSWRSRTRGERTRCRSAASTSQSAMTGRWARTANDAVRLVFPVPPLPLMMTISFMRSRPPGAFPLPGTGFGLPP